MIDTKKKDMDYILAFKDWVRWPFCPVVKRDGGVEAGFGLIYADNELEVFVGANLYHLEELSKYESKRYETIEALLEEWRVD